MSKYITEPATEETCKRPVTGSTAIEAIAVTLSDGTAMLVAREGCRYRLRMSRGGQSIAVRSIPTSRSFIGEVLDELCLDCNARATLYTLLTLRSFTYTQR